MASSTEQQRTAPGPCLSAAPAMHVLVVEDEPAILAFLAWTLEDEGYSVATATNGREALAEMQRRTPDVLLLDLMMPVMDGWEVIAACRADPAMRRLPIVVLSAVYNGRLWERPDVQAFMPKPFDIDALLATIRDVSH